MKNFLKKLNMVSNQSEDLEGPASSSPSLKGNNNKLSDVSSPERFSYSTRSHLSSELKPFSAIQGWLSSVKHRNSSSPSSSSNLSRGERMEPSDSVGSIALEAALDAVRRHAESRSNSRHPDVEEEAQIQSALELSAKEDPEAVQIEAVKQISLGSCAPDNTLAEVVAYRYWNSNSLGYDDKILDGFYDLYGILTDPISMAMPSLVDLQRTPMSDNISWEAILVNRAADSKLLKLEQKALEITAKSKAESSSSIRAGLVQNLSAFVYENMGGPVVDPDNMLIAWKNLRFNLKATLGSMVLPLGSLKIGLARHRALLFKVLADSMGIPCRLVKGQQFTGSDDLAMNFVKMDDGREYIVDLMAAPGTLIPADAAGAHIYEEPFFSPSPLSRDAESIQVASYNSVVTSSFGEISEFGGSGGSDAARYDKMFHENVVLWIKGEECSKRATDVSKKPYSLKKEAGGGFSHRPSQLYSHARSPSWTEGVSSPAVRRMKVKDVSQYMIDAAKENPNLAQKLHDVLLESGVAAPANLFSEMYQEQLNELAMEAKSPRDDNGTQERDSTGITGFQDDNRKPLFLSPLPHHGPHSNSLYDHVESHIDRGEATGENVPSEPEASPVKHSTKVPVAAEAAAAAAVVAATKTSSDTKLELPVAAAATTTAAAVVATTVAISKQYENLEISSHLPDSPVALINQIKYGKSNGDSDIAVYDQRGSGERDHEAFGLNSKGERISDRPTGTKSDVTLDDVADCEIPLEDIALGERIGLGSYGEVYRGDWHGTKVAVKKFLDQDIAGESLEEFKSEVRIMKRVRHPNVVLFMGAVTRPPNLSIITEFLPRGSLYRLLHRPNNQLDERRRLRVALDAARGMNYLHNCTPVIVHLDLKSPNLLVDKNWVVKVCDFGLSRMKHSTFLSSRSTAGTNYYTG